MKAGNTSRRIEIRTNYPAGRDASGQPIPNPAPVATVWAEYVPPSAAREPYTADQYASFVDGEFMMRYPTTYTLDPAQHFILFDGRSYNILGWVETKRREEIRVTVKARLEAGAPA